MPEQLINLIKGDKVVANVDYRDQVPVNMTPIIRPVIGADGYMLELPGLTQYGEGDGIDRGAVWNDRFQALFRVSGDSLVSVDENGASTVLGTTTFSLDNPHASMPYSFNSQAIVVDGKYFLYDPVNGARRILDPEVGTPIDCVWIDGLFVFTDGDFLYHTDIDDEEAIDPLKYATSEYSPDKTKGVSLTTDNKLIAWNRYTTEYFVNTPNEFFAFTRIPSRNVQYGIVGTYCKTQIAGTWYFLGGSAESNVSVWELGVGTATNISSRTIDALIAQYSEEDLRFCTLETRTIDTYSYLIVRLPNETVMLNITLGRAAGPGQAWSVLQSGLNVGNIYRAVNGVFDPRRSQWVYGDYANANLCYLDESVATHYEELVECALFTPFIYLEPYSIDEIEIVSIPGFNIVDDASVFVSLTYDGVSYSTEVPISYGAPGAYTNRFIIRRLGAIQDWFALKLRWVSTSRMAFASAKMKFS